MLSFWEKQSLPVYDFAVVGAGIMGASVAFELRQKYPNAAIVVLERGIFPSGASTKNAGFACFGSPTEILHDIELMGEDNATELLSHRMEGIRILKQRLSPGKLGLTSNGGYELVLHEPLKSDKIEYLNKLLSRIDSQAVFSDVSGMITSFGFSSDVLQMLFCNTEEQIDSGKMMQHYLRLLDENNIRVVTGANVKSIEEDVLFIENPSNSFSLKADKIILCTNAFAKELFPEIPIKPGRGQVLITKPIHGLSFRGSFHFEEGFYYFRNVEDRLLFGGGRNMDVLTEETTVFAENKMILDDLVGKIQTIILPGVPFEVDHTWQGIMGFAENKCPQIL
jgi:glycine/D-amino acid oxidase-like deaminating enzyme